MTTVEKQARMFGCTPDQVRALMQRNADQLRNMTDKQLAARKMTREYVNERIANYERQIAE
jgi:hypothetical protein